MAEEVVSQALVLDNHRDRLAKRIDDVKSSLRNELLARQKIAFCKMFLDLCVKYFKFRDSDLREIEDNELLFLESEVFKKAERVSKNTKYFFMPLISLVPILGWFVVFSLLYDKCDMYCPSSFLSYDYCKLRGILMEKEGKDFFPFEELKRILQKH